MKSNKSYILPIFCLLASTVACGDNSALSRLKNDFYQEKHFSFYAIDKLYEVLGKDSALGKDYANGSLQNSKRLFDENQKLKQQITSLKKAADDSLRNLEEVKNINNNLKDDINSKEQALLNLTTDKNKLQDQLTDIIQAINNTEIPISFIKEEINTNKAIDQLKEIGLKFKEARDEKNKEIENLKSFLNQSNQDLFDYKQNLCDIINETNKEKYNLNIKRDINNQNIVTVIRAIYVDHKEMIKANNEQKLLIDNIRLESKKHKNNIQSEECNNIDFDKNLLTGVGRLYKVHYDLHTELKKAIMKIDSVFTDNKSKKSNISEKIEDLIKYYDDLLKTNQNNKTDNEKKIMDLNTENNKFRNYNKKLENLITTSVNKLNNFSQAHYLDIKDTEKLQFVAGDNPIIDNFDKLFGPSGKFEGDIKNMRKLLITPNDLISQVSKTKYNCQLFKEVEDKYIELSYSNSSTATSNQSLLDYNKKIQKELKDEKNKLDELLKLINNTKLFMVYPGINGADEYDKVSKMLNLFIQESSNIEKVNGLLFDKDLQHNKGDLFFRKVDTTINYYKNKVQNLEKSQISNNSNNYQKLTDLNNEVNKLNNERAEFETKLKKIQVAINTADIVINNLGLKKANDFDTTVQLVIDVCSKYNKDLLLLENCINNKKIDGNNFEVVVFNKLKDYIKDLGRQILNISSGLGDLKLKDQEISKLNRQLTDLKTLLDSLVGKINNSLLSQDKLGYNNQLGIESVNDSFKISNLDLLSNIETDIKIILPKLDLVSNCAADVCSKGVFCKKVEKLIIMYNNLQHETQKLKDDKKNNDNTRLNIDRELYDTKNKLETLTKSICNSNLISQNLIQVNSQFLITESIINAFSDKSDNNVRKEKDYLQEIINGSRIVKNTTSNIIPIFKQAGDKIFELQDQINELKKKNTALQKQNDLFKNEIAQNKNKQKQIDDLKNDNDQIKRSFIKLEKNTNDLIASINTLLGKNGLGYDNLLVYDKKNQDIINLNLLKDKEIVITELNKVSQEIVSLNLKTPELPVKAYKGSFLQQINGLIQFYKNIQNDLIVEKPQGAPESSAYQKINKSLLYDMLLDTIYLAKRLALLVGQSGLVNSNKRGGKDAFDFQKFTLTWYQTGAMSGVQAREKLDTLERFLKSNSYDNNLRLAYNAHK